MFWWNPIVSMKMKVYEDELYMSYCSGTMKLTCNSDDSLWAVNYWLLSWRRSFLLVVGTAYTAVWFRSLIFIKLQNKINKIKRQTTVIKNLMWPNIILNLKKKALNINSDNPNFLKCFIIEIFNEESFFFSVK